MPFVRFNLLEGRNAGLWGGDYCDQRGYIDLPRYQEQTGA